ncbi:MAG: hypothetical protein SWK90_07395 [Chloroflexota bacterium]|nr:hypothetical protein [Chloroflexota bacterium]
MDRLFSAILSMMMLLGCLFVAILLAMSPLAIWAAADVLGPASATPTTVAAGTSTPTISPVPTAAPSPTRAPGATVIPFPVPTIGPTTTPFPVAPQNPRFGIAWSSSFYNSQRVTLPTGQAIKAGATWDRWPIPWYIAEPNADGHFRWVHQDFNFFLAATRDRPCWFDPSSTDPALKVLVVLTGIPEGYVLAREGQIESILGLGEPVFLVGDGPAKINPENRWGHFVYQATSTFGSVVDGWEIGNEGGFPLPPDAYIRAMEVACQVIITTDPTAKVLLGSPEHPIALETAQGEETMYRELLVALATAVQEDESLRDCISGLALHTYARPDYSHYIVSHIADLTADLDWRPALWITETGVQHPDRDEPGQAHPAQCRETGFHCVSDEEQASYLIQQYVLVTQAFTHKQRDGVVIYHRLKDEFDRDPHPKINDGPWGLVDFDNTPLPAYHAARLVSATLSGARYLREEGQADPTYRHILFADQSQRLTHVLWATTAQEVTVSLPLHPNRVTCYQQNGELCPSEIQVSTDDVFTLTLPGATTQETGHPDDPFCPAPIVGGRTFIIDEE